MIYICPVSPTMTAIATNFLNLPFAHQLVDAFKEYSNEYEFSGRCISQDNATCMPAMWKTGVP